MASGRFKLLSTTQLPAFSLLTIAAIISLAFAASIGVLFLILACALPGYSNWWPMFVLVFYFLSPLPCLIVSRHTDSTESSSALWETALFITTGIVVSAYGLPIVLAHSPLTKPVIQWGACGLVMAGNTVVFLTILGFFFVFNREDDFAYGEAKVSAAISEQLNAIETAVESQKERIARKRLLLNRVCHNWSCISTAAATPTLSAEAQGTDWLLSEPIMVPLDSLSPVVSHHRLRSTPPLACRQPFTDLRVHQRLWRSHWVIMVEVETSETTPHLTRLFPVSDGQWADGVSWKLPASSREGKVLRLFASCSVPDFTDASVLRVHLFLTDNDVHLSIGDVALSWEDILHDRVSSLPENVAEMEALSEEDQQISSHILDAFQHLAPFTVTDSSLLSLLCLVPFPTTSSAWIRRPPALVGCRISMDDAVEEGVESIVLRTNDAAQIALFTRWLHSQLPTDSQVSSVKEEQNLDPLWDRSLAQVEDLETLYRREVDRMLEDIGGPKLTEENTSSPTKLAALLKEVKENQRAASHKLGKTVRERLRKEASIIRENISL